MEYELGAPIGLRDIVQEPSDFDMVLDSNTSPGTVSQAGILQIALDLQSDLSRSSRGVGWANGYCGIVIGTSATRSACFRDRGSTPDTISRSCFFFFPKCPLAYDIEDHLLKSSDVVGPSSSKSELLPL